MRNMKWAALLLAVAGMLILAAAGAEQEADLGMYDLYDSSAITVTWQDMNVPRDTNLPVYSAPFEDAWRGAKGKASVSVSEGFTLLGTLDDGAWGLVDYEIDSRSRRLGWIRMPEGAARPSEFGDMWIKRTLLRVTRDVTLTDDPQSGSRKIRTVKAGEEVIGMFEYRQEGKVYVETTNEGKTVWGLIPRNAVTDATESLLTVDGDTLRIREGVTIIGECYEFRYDPDNEDYRDVTCIRPGDVSVGILDLYYLSDYGIRRIEMPESMRWLGMEGIGSGSLEELRLTGGMDASDEAFYDARFDRIIFARDYTGGIPGGEYDTVREWKVEEGNPVYRDIDGVLFTADGKTLLRYPNGRREEHYDVPAGTEVIGDRAFADDLMDIRLRSISLPVGLKKIGEYAFSGCGYLVSMAVPLTVTELAPTAFRNCVSLERLSLPPGMTADLGDWAKAEDYSSAFRGDNWATYPKPAEKEEWELEYGETFRAYPVRLDNAEGSGTVPVYASAGDGTPFDTEPAGIRKYVWGVRNGRAEIEDGRWVNLENTRNEAEDVFFRIEDGEPADPARRTGAGGKTLQYSGIWDEEAAFYTSAGGVYEEYSFPIRETLLYREKTGDGTRMGFIMPEGVSAAMLDAPGGTKVNHLYFGTQARVLDEADGWYRIETAYGTGWIARNELVIVAEMPETDE